MRALSKKRAKDGPVRAAAEAELGRRNGVGVCARCGEWAYVNGHERLARSQGGDPTRPDCLLCRACNTWCEDQPVWSAFHGWKISSKWPRCDDLGPNEALRIDGTVHTFPLLVVAP